MLEREEVVLRRREDGERRCVRICVAVGPKKDVCVGLDLTPACRQPPALGLACVSIGPAEVGAPPATGPA